MQQEQTKMTKAEMVEAMKRLYIEIGLLTEQIDDIKTEAREQGMPCAMMSKIAKLQADSKIDDALDKNEAFATLVEEIRNN